MASTSRQESAKMSEFEKLQQISVITYLKNMFGADLLLKTNFFVIHINVFHDEWVVPAEVAVTFFNLTEGVGNALMYHKICNTVLPPLSLAEKVKKNCELTHKIYPAGQADDVVETMKEVYAFIEQYGNARMPPPIFAAPSNIQNVLTVIKKFGGHDLRRLHVLDLSILFYHLKNMTFQERDDARLSFDRSTQLEIFEEDKHCFNLELTCVYHLGVYQPMFCSRAIVVRVIYMICEHCCPQFGITLMVGSHKPKIGRMLRGRSEMIQRRRQNVTEEDGENDHEGPRNRHDRSPVNSDMSDDDEVEGEGEVLDSSNAEVLYMAPEYRENLLLGNSNYTTLATDGSGPSRKRKKFSYSKPISLKALWDCYLEKEMRRVFREIMRDT